MKTVKLLIAYDGTNYSGWQLQPNALSIQELLQRVLSTLLREKVVLTSSGRTDSGVHARGQVAHYRSTKEAPSLRAINGMLPKDIRVLAIEEESPSFHAQYSAKGKIYHYHIWTEPVLDPMKRLYVLHVRARCDLDLLCSCLPAFIGTHDFSAFANSNQEGAAAKNAVRTIWRIDPVSQEGGLRLEFAGDGFLYKMIRNIVGLLLDIACGKKQPAEIERILASKDRKQAGKAAPAHGLFLMQVLYESPEPLSSSQIFAHPLLGEQMRSREG